MADDFDPDSYGSGGQTMVGQGWNADGSYFPIYSQEEMDRLGAEGFTVTNYPDKAAVDAAAYGDQSHTVWTGGERVGSDDTGGGSASGGDPYMIGDAGAAAADQRFRTDKKVSKQDVDGLISSDDEDDDDTSSSSSSDGGSPWYPRSSGGRSSGGYSSGYSSGGGSSSGNPYSPVDAMRGAFGGGAGAMGVALRQSMGAPIPYMPGQDDEDEEEDYREPAFVPGGAGVNPYGVPSSSTPPSNEGRLPPWPGAYQVRQATTGGGNQNQSSNSAQLGSSPYMAGRRPTPRIQPPVLDRATSVQAQRGRRPQPRRRGR